jgi:hypothetical protein
MTVWLKQNPKYSSFFAIEILGWLNYIENIVELLMISLTITYEQMFFCKALWTLSQFFKPFHALRTVILSLTSSTSSYSPKKIYLNWYLPMNLFE